MVAAVACVMMNKRDLCLLSSASDLRGRLVHSHTLSVVTDDVANDVRSISADNSPTATTVRPTSRRRRIWDSLRSWRRQRSYSRDRVRTLKRDCKADEMQVISASQPELTTMSCASQPDFTCGQQTIGSLQLKFCVVPCCLSNSFITLLYWTKLCPNGPCDCPGRNTASFILVNHENRHASICSVPLPRPPPPPRFMSRLLLHPSACGSRYIR